MLHFTNLLLIDWSHGYKVLSQSAYKEIIDAFNTFLRRKGWNQIVIHETPNVVVLLWNIVAPLTLALLLSIVAPATWFLQIYDHIACAPFGMTASFCEVGFSNPSQ